MVEVTAAILPQDRPRYLMGVGTPDDLLRVDRARYRHVRLRDADPLGPPLPGVHLERQAQSAQRALCRRCHAARSGKRVPGGAIRARLSPSSGQVGRDARRHAAQLRQCPVLSGTDGARPRGNRTRALRGFFRSGGATLPRGRRAGRRRQVRRWRRYPRPARLWQRRVACARAPRDKVPTRSRWPHPTGSTRSARCRTPESRASTSRSARDR